MSKQEKRQEWPGVDTRVMISGAGFIVFALLVAFSSSNPALVSSILSTLVGALVWGLFFVFGLFFTLSIIAKYKRGAGDRNSTAHSLSHVHRD